MLAVRVLFFTFESLYTRKVGGLAEASIRLAQGLASRGVRVEVYTPAHGSVDACRDPVFKLTLNSSEYCVAELPETRPRHYAIGGGVLDDPEVYSPQRLLVKSLVYARVASEYLARELSGEELVVAHAHDWHSFPVLLALSARAAEKRLRLRSVYQVHLLSKARISLDDLTRWLGVSPDTPLRGALGVKSLEEYYRESRGYVERLAGLVADVVVTVSPGYAKSVMRAVGPASWDRVSYVYNASPVTWSEVASVIKSRSARDPSRPETRRELRAEVLLRGICSVKLVYPSSRVEEEVKRLINHYDAACRPFKRSGPLLVGVGRASKQKGFDFLVKSLDRLVGEVPSIRVVLVAAPTEYGADVLRELLEHTPLFPDNLRVLAGYISREDAIYLYYVASATIIPSRSEPFGLVALESMAAGTPVAASRVGGLQDIVVDVRIAGSRGSGVLFSPLDREDLVESTAHLIRLVESPDPLSAEIRESCIKRASEFTWEKSAERLLEVYASTPHSLPASQ
ncbi:MAG: glycogen/starch synthase [Desulfurococcaceae archaeon]|nr:glycogen/starch synthase [Desulfurococcaceae archaeon]